MKAHREKNKETLKAAIRQLPLHAAPEQVWSKINQGLDQQQQWQTALQQLPAYAPPAQVWEQIEAGLDRPQSHPTVYRRLKRLRPWRVAAAVVLLSCSIWWLSTTENRAEISKVYSQEIHMQSSFVTDWEQEDETMAMVVNEVDRSPVADRVVVQRLKQEYQELTDARTEVEEMLQRYGRDQNLLREIARIERARSKVVKQLAAWI